MNVALTNGPAGEGGFAPIWRAGQAAWPGFDVSGEDFGHYLARHADEAALGSSERAADLYLACACARGNPRALEAFDRVLATTVSRAVARIDPSRSFADVVTQDLRARLLMGDPPKIVEYAGRAPLTTWLKTVAVRAALNARRTKGEQEHDSVPSDLVARGEPELELVRAKYRPDFEAALRIALAALPERDRTILCLTLRDGATLESLAGRYKVGKSTAARWLAAAREELTSETRRILKERLRLTQSELESLAVVVRSDLAVSIVRLLEA